MVAEINTIERDQAPPIAIRFRYSRDRGAAFRELEARVQNCTGAAVILTEDMAFAPVLMTAMNPGQIDYALTVEFLPQIRKLGHRVSEFNDNAARLLLLDVMAKHPKIEQRIR